ncbi:hypothetical protein GCM10009680_43120 [Streptomyces yatensis]|uniref:Uncharacterized protein n=1 Tax=Streptomyces yatensis TaxID=155177 RepID=A0ABN2I4C6_9ACTN
MCTVPASRSTWKGGSSADLTARGQAPATAAAEGRKASTVSLHTDLAMAREEIKTLRAERDQFRTAMRQQLGHQLDQITDPHEI